MPPKKSNKPEVVEEKPATKSQKQTKKVEEPAPVPETKGKGKGKKVEEKPVEQPVEKPTKGGSLTKQNELNSKNSGKKTAKKEVVEEKPVAEPVSVPAPETKGKGKGKKVEESKATEEKPSKKVVKTTVESTDDSEVQFKKWKDDWAAAVAKITEHQKITQKLEEERDELVKKMENYLAQKKGTLGENILETTSKIKKAITKVDVNVAQIDDNSDSDSDTTDDDDDDDDDDEDATPAVPLKKGKAPAKFVAKKGVVQEDSDSDDDSE